MGHRLSCIFGPWSTSWSTHALACIFFKMNLERDCMGRYVSHVWKPVNEKNGLNWHTKKTDDAKFRSGRLTTETETETSKL